MDAINAGFELVGAILMVLNIRAVLRDKMVRGVNWLVIAFFASWGFWNLLYYPHLGQWFSFAAGVLLVTGNTVYAALLVYYIRKEKRHE